MKKLILLLVIMPTLLFAQEDSISIVLNNFLAPKGKNHVQSMIYHIEKPKQNYLYSEGFGLDKKGGNAITQDAQFRIASITKPFVAIVILQLMEEGKLQLSDKASKYLKEIDYINFDKLHIYQGKSFSEEITIEHLLSHRTGFADIFNDEGGKFYLGIFFHKKRQYDPKRIVEKYYHYELNERPHFKPEEDFYYSDMNYVLLGLMIEKLEQKPLAEVLRKRIIEPLKMNNTFFEFYEERRGSQQQIHQYFKNIDMTKINTSFDWAGGGLVSNASDLSTFVKALFGGQLLKESSLAKMTEMKFTGENHNRYGLGLYESHYNGKVFYGHYGFYGSYMGYSPDDDTILIYNISQSRTSFSEFQLTERVLKLTE